MSDKGFVHTWSGMANQWEVDELGHLNMRYYLAKAQEARYMFMMGLGLRDGFHATSPSTVRLRDVHIRYMKEVRPGGQLHIETGVVELAEDYLRLVHVMYHADGAVAATFSERLDHIYRRTGQCFNWPQSVRRKAEDFMVDMPEVANSKGLRETSKVLSQSDVISAGLDHVGTGVFLPHEANLFGRISAQAYIGRLSDSIAVFSKGWPEAHLWHSDSEVMGVMLELKLCIHADTAPGDPYHIHSAVVGATSNVRRLNHYFVNPFSGKAYAHVEAVNGLLHMKERRLVKAAPETVTALQDVARTDIL